MYICILYTHSYIAAYYIDLSATAQVASKTLGFCDPHIELAK